MVNNSDANASNNNSLSWKDFSARLKVLWDRDGDIHEALKLIESHPEHKKNTGRTGRQQILRVLGEMRLLSGEVIIPERVDAPVYKAMPDRIMYCVYSTPVFNSNGYSTRSRGVAGGLKAAGADVVVVGRSGYPWDWKIDTTMPKRQRLVSKLDEIDYVHLPNGGMNVLSPSAHIEQAADAFVQEALIQRPSYIQSASNYRVALPALIAARRLGVPFVYEVRGLWEITGASNNPGFENTDRFYAMREYEARVAREADHVFAITDQVKQELISRGVEESRISLAPNAVDPKKFYPQVPTRTMVSSLGINPNLPVIGFAGSIVKYEGLHTLLRASLILEERGIKHQIVLAGSGNTEDLLKKFAQEHKMEWVSFLGRIPQDQVPQLLCVSNIVVTPRDRTVITELVTALKPLEAFAAGRAVVLSDVAPNLDLAGNEEERARVFNAEDPDAMADVLQDLLEEPTKRVNLAKNARRWIEEERNWSSIGNKMLGQIKSIASTDNPNLPGDFKLYDLRIGYLGDQRLRELIGKYAAVVELDDEDKLKDELRDLDFVIVDLSKRSVTQGVNWQGAILSLDADLEVLLVNLQNLGIPCVGLLAEGLSGSSLDAKLVGLLDALLVGNFDGAIELLEDPVSSSLRLGLFPPVLDELKDEQFHQAGEDGLVLVIDDTGISRYSIDSLIGLVDSDGSSAGPDKFQLHSECFENLEQAPDAVYIRKSVREDTSRDIISKFGLRSPLFWEQENTVSSWFGNVLEEGIHLIEFVALVHQWNEQPSSRVELLEAQKSQLLASHSVETWLLLISRSLGFPVTRRENEDFGAVLPINVIDRSRFRNDALVTLLRSKASALAPILRERLKM